MKIVLEMLVFDFVLYGSYLRILRGIFKLCGNFFCL